MKIPENAKPYRAIVNGVEHVYEAGADVEVAPGVEELIEAADNFPADPDPVVPPFAGGGGGVLAVTATNGTLDKTWQEIRNATFSVLEMADEQYLQIGCVEDEGDYIVSYWTFGMTEPLLFIADSADGYPSVQ